MSVAVFEREFAPDQPAGEAMPPSGMAFSAVLHLSVLVLIALGLPTLFRQPPPEDTPIAVELVTIAPETRATHPNPYRPKAEAKPDLPVAPPAPKPEPKPEPPPPPTPTPPPSAAAPPPPAPAPAPEPPKAEIKAPPPPPPPPIKPVAAQAPPPPRPPQPKPEPRQQAKQEPAAFQQLMKNLAKSEKKSDPAAFDAMTKQLTEKKPDPAEFDSLLKNLAHDQPTPSEDAPPQPRRKQVASAAASSQPKAPLGSQLTASEKDLIVQQIERCWVVPAGARDADNLIIEIKAVVNQDGTVRQATIVDTGRYSGDPFFRAAADSAKRAVLNPNCSPLKVPPDKFDEWRNLDLFFNPKDLL